MTETRHVRLAPDTSNPAALLQAAIDEVAAGGGGEVTIDQAAAPIRLAGIALPAGVVLRGV